MLTHRSTMSACARTTARTMAVRVQAAGGGLRAARLAAAYAGKPSPFASFAGRYSTVSRAVAEEAAAPGSDESFEPTNQLFVSNLSWNTSSDALADHFSQSPGFSRAMVMMRDGRSRGMGLVEYETVDQASAAIESLNGSSLDGRSINVRESRPAPPAGDRPPRREREYGARSDVRGDRPERQPRPPATPGATVYVGNLAFSTQWQELKDHFKAVADVERSSVATGQDGRSRGFGFVQFSSPDDAQRAVDQLNNSELDGRTLQVNIYRPRQPEM